MAEEDSFATAKSKKRRGGRGKYAEGKVREVLVKVRAEDQTFGFERPVDTRAAGRMMPPTLADFVCKHLGKKELALEVKETDHEFRLSVSAFPQFPRILHHIQCGGRGCVVVYHSSTKEWRIIDVSELPPRDRGSWDLSAYRTYDKLEPNLRDIL